MGLHFTAEALRIAVEPAARRVARGAHGDKDIVMRLEFGGAAADGDDLAGEGQLDAEMSHLPRPLRAMPALDDHPARGDPVEDTLQTIRALADLRFDSRRGRQIAKGYLQRNG